MNPTVKKSINPLPMKERMKVPRQLMPEQAAEEERAEHPTQKTDVVEVVLDDLQDRGDRETLETDKGDREDEADRKRAPARSPHTVRSVRPSLHVPMVLR